MKRFCWDLRISNKKQQQENLFLRPEFPGFVQGESLKYIVANHSNTHLKKKNR